MVCVGKEQRSLCRFWDCIQVLHFGLFCWPWWLLHFFWGVRVRSSRYSGHLSLIQPFLFILIHQFQNVDIHSCHLLFDHFEFALIHGPNIPDSYPLYHQESLLFPIFVSAPYVFFILTPYQIYGVEIFSPIHKLPFHLCEVSCCQENKVDKFQGEILRNVDEAYNLKDVFLLPDFFRCFSLFKMLESMVWKRLLWRSLNFIIIP